MWDAEDGAQYQCREGGGGVGASHPLTTPQVSPLATCAEGWEAPASNSARRLLAARSGHLYPRKTFCDAICSGELCVGPVRGSRRRRFVSSSDDSAHRLVPWCPTTQWLVARTMAKQMVARVEAATAPFQHAGCESVAHIFQNLTEGHDRVNRRSGCVRVDIS